jgi:hypothetical protein
MTHTYHIHTAPESLPITADILNTYGADGWRLVTLVSRPGVPERAVFERSVEGAKVAAPAAKKVGK